jgi:NADPH:quinone reductase-like Zn-dependent oxidoreductase
LIRSNTHRSGQLAWYLHRTIQNVLDITIVRAFQNTCRHLSFYQLGGLQYTVLRRLKTPFQENLALRYHGFGDPRRVLALERSETIRRPPKSLRVRMSYAPINPSDIIPITGAYRHLIVLPKTAGYEGVGKVICAPPDMAHMLGKRVMPLRGDGTWQQYIHCDPQLTVPVPDNIPDTLAARAYINPMSAHHMLQRWPVAGRNVVLTGAGSAIAALLAQWAQANGAATISGIYRSPQRRNWLQSLGVEPIAEGDTMQVKKAARQADVTYDAVGGRLGSTVLNSMRSGKEFISYGLLSGQQVQAAVEGGATHRRFHLRDTLRDLDPSTWQESFRVIWPRLSASRLQDTKIFPLECWQDALDAFETPGRAQKPLFKF